MHLIEILLPKNDNDGNLFDTSLYHTVKEELNETFGGVTVFARNPAQGLWKDAGKTRQDEIVIYEIMTEALDKAWWHDYRLELQERFRQDEIIIRAVATTLL